MEMNGLLWVNLIAFLLVTAYAVGLFVYLIKTRIAYIKLGKKVEFDNRVKERLVKFGSMYLDRRSYLRIKRAGSFTSCSFMVLS